MENILIHTGNIVNWKQMKGAISKTANAELSECITSTVSGWLESADKDDLQYAINAQCINAKYMETVTEEERNELKLTVKLFVDCRTATADTITDALSEVMTSLNVSFIETVILSVPEDQRSIESLDPLWSVLEQHVKEVRVYSLGVSDLNKDQLQELYEWTTVKPCINQVNLTTCCVIPPELTEYAREHDIQLLTHNDPPVILSDTDFQQLMSGLLTNPADSSLWMPSWVARYSALIKCRGVIKFKGYAVRATRDVRQLPYMPTAQRSFTAPELDSVSA